MSLIRNTIKSKLTIAAANRNAAVSFLLRDTPNRYFSTESEKPPSSTADATVDSIFQTPRTGAFYGKLSPVSVQGRPGTFARYKLKTDIINLLEGSSKLTPDDVKFVYNRNYVPVGVVMQFPSFAAYDDAIKSVARKGRLYRLDRADRSQWDAVQPYGGKTVLLEGVPRNALVEDVERFLSGSDYDASALQLQTRPGFPDPVRYAVVPFHSPTQAMDAFIKKNRSFCLNSQISMRVLQ